MPRKSTSSVVAETTNISMPQNMDAMTRSALEADTSMLSIATDGSTTTNVKTNGKAGKEDPDSLGIDDLLLPRTLTSRLARGILPANTSIQKDALLALTKAATVFISYLAHNANELTSKKTVGPQDVLKALQEIEMGGVMELGALGADGEVGGRLERELEVFESVVRGKRKGYREKVKARESGASSLLASGGKGSVDGDDGGERKTKRTRYEDGESEQGQHDARNDGSGGEETTTTEAYRVTQQQQHNQHPTAMAPPQLRPATNGAMPNIPNDDTIPDDDIEDDREDNADEEEVENAHSQDDEVDQEEEEGTESEAIEDDENQRDEDDLYVYGPDDQLRYDMNRGEDDDDDDDSGSSDGSD